MIEIKHRYTDAVLFSQECDSLKIAVERAVKAGADLRGADLSSAYLNSADLTGADLRCANLRGADLNRADLSGANLRGANLTDADLDSADLRGANLTCANLNSAYLNSAKIHSGIIINKVPLQITGTTWHITIWDEHMQIGCEFHSLADWFSFDDHRILEMDGKTALKFWRNWKKPLRAICKAEGRK